MEPIPDWLAAMTKAARMTAFTDEFDHDEDAWEPSHAPSFRLPVRHRRDGKQAGLKRLISDAWVRTYNQTYEL